MGKVKAAKDTPHYTLEEVENIISALADHVDYQLVVALAFFLGLRPGEIEGLKWEDIDNESVHIRRAVVYGKIGETKTAESRKSSLDQTCADFPEALARKIRKPFRRVGIPE